MKIALDATYSIGRDLSGVGVYSRELLSGLSAAHPETRFAYCYRSQRYLRSFADRLPSNARRRLLTEHRLPRADLFHGLNQRLPAVPARHTVTTFHDLFVLTGEYSTPDFRRRFAEQARQASERSELIIAVSEFTARQVIDLLGVDAGRVRVVHHGVRTREGPPLAREKIILHVGAIQLRKNVARLVKAFEAVGTDWQLVLAGSAGFGAADIMAKIEASPSAARIRVLGYVPAGELSNLYRRAAIFAFPSLDEGFGMPVLEAMSAGTPVITSNRSALPEVAGDAACLIDPENADELASALTSLARDESRRAELTHLGLERASQFTWNEAVVKTWRVYRELLPA